MGRNCIILLAAVLLTVSCYDDYVRDYDSSAALIAYQYDLRTFVIGEGMHFDFTVGLAGVMENGRDRAVTVVNDNDLVWDNLARFAPEGTPSFWAIDGLLGNSSVGVLSQPYVTDAVRQAGIGMITPLPADHYSITGLDGMKIKKGRHTATATVYADSLKMVTDSRAFRACYALGFELKAADVDRIPPERSFSVIVVRCENRFFGNWYHGGVTRVVRNADGTEVSRSVYPTAIPQAEDKLYVLTTRSAYSVETNHKVGGSTIVLSFSGDDITVSSTSVAISAIGEGSRFNGALLLQDRQLFLNYKFDNGDGTSSLVTDTLTFRNRVRDGVNEWQDENPLHYR